MNVSALLDDCVLERKIEKLVFRESRLIACNGNAAFNHLALTLICGFVEMLGVVGFYKTGGKLHGVYRLISFC